MLRLARNTVNETAALAAAAAGDPAPVPAISFWKIAFRASLAAAAASGFACAPLPPQSSATTPAQRGDQYARPASVTVEQRPSPNFDVRRPNFVVIHHTSDSRVEDALRTLTDPARQVSSHYLIARDGRILQLVDDRARAWHAGESYWAGVEDVNSASIGIELDNDGRESFAEPLIAALLELLADIKTRFNIPEANFIGHGDIAPGRKVDPSVLFPWKRLAENGFGLWCEPPYPSVPAGVDSTLLLQAFGYSVARPDAAVAAFKRHFVPDDPSPRMTEKDHAVLYCLVLQKQGP
jgi:N-acetylmuramoyl-L-alanine amidase